MVHDQVDDRRTLHLAHVERPLIPLEENRVQRLCRGIEVIEQEFPLDTVGIHRNVARQHLLIGARHVPAEVDRGQTILPFLQIDQLGTGFQRHTGHAHMTAGIYRCVVHARRAAGRQNDVRAGKQRQTVGTRTGEVECEQAEHLTVLHQQAYCLHLVEDANALLLHAALERLGHKARGQRSG